MNPEKCPYCGAAQTTGGYTCMGVHPVAPEPLPPLVAKAYNHGPEQSDMERVEAFLCGHDLDEKYPAHFGIMRQTLAALLAEVRAEERERCAKVCEQVGDGERRAFNGEVYLTDADKRAAEFVQGADVCAAAIRKGEP